MFMILTIHIYIEPQKSPTITPPGGEVQGRQAEGGILCLHAHLEQKTEGGSAWDLNISIYIYTYIHI